MKKNGIIFSLIVVFAIVAQASTLQSEQPKNDLSNSKVRVGTFDSRALAIAYYRTESFASHMQGLIAEHKKADDSGEKERVKKLEDELNATQELIHKQGFSTWPVDNILITIEEKIPELAKQLEVDLIISKWDICYQRSGIELIDVTLDMVKLINTNEQILKMIEDLIKQPPLSLEEFQKNAH
jgi:hypothetical protein